MLHDGGSPRAAPHPGEDGRRCRPPFAEGVRSASFTLIARENGKTIWDEPNGVREATSQIQRVFRDGSAHVAAPMEHLSGRCFRVYGMHSVPASDISPPSQVARSRLSRQFELNAAVYLDRRRVVLAVANAWAPAWP